MGKEYYVSAINGNSETSSEKNCNEESKDQFGKDRSHLAKRETWAKKIDFLFAIVGFSVGFGNVWRFPYLCYRNGGGAFLLPYILAVAIFGFPMVFLEVSMGQFMRKSAIGSWRLCPLFQGIGVITTMILFLCNCYYILILAWDLYFLFSSFTSVLPWSNCGNEWNTPRCSETHNRTSHVFNNTFDLLGNETVSSVYNTTAQDIFTDPSTEYWERRVLGISDSINDPQNIKWDIALCLLLSWIIIYLVIFNGIKTSGKVMYFTASSPYVLLIILLIRGATLDGAKEGLLYYLTPQLRKLGDAKVWYDAGAQVFYSNAVGMGTSYALGSFNKFRHNSLRDVAIFSCVNGCSSILAGLVIFSTLGFMAKKQNLSIADVAESGPGLVFVVYPEALAQMPAAPVWAVLFFCMILMVGLDSQFVAVECLASAVDDWLPKYSRIGHRKKIVIAVICIVSFLIGLPMTTHGGVYIFQIFDFYVMGRMLLIVGFLECVVISYIYGADRMLDNIQMMIGFRPSIYLKFCWCLITPGLILVLLIVGFINYSEVTYERRFSTYIYPTWAIVVGWLLTLSCVIGLPVTMIIKFAKAEGNFRQRAREVVKPILKKFQVRENEDRSKIILDLTDDKYGDDPDQELNLMSAEENIL